MIYIKQQNNKAVISSDENDLLLPEGTYICAVYFMDEVRFYGSENEEGLLLIGQTINPTVSTIAEAKTEIDKVGCRFLNGILTTN